VKAILSGVELANVVHYFQSAVNKYNHKFKTLKWIEMMTNVDLCFCTI